MNELYQMIEGSRSLIISQVDEETPIVVIMELAESMNYKVDRNLTSDNYINGLIDGINQYINGEDHISIMIDLKRLNPLNSIENLTKVAKLINSDNHTWTTEQLFQAFSNLIVYASTNKINIPKEFTSGRMIPNKPENLDSTILYKLCMQIGVRTSRRTTLEDMDKILRLYLTPRLELINMIINQKSDIIWDKNIEKISTTFRDFFERDSSEVILEKYQPKNHEESIIFCKLKYNIDLFNALSPLDEYSSINDDYSPHDTRMKKLISRDKSWIVDSKYLLPHFINIYTDDELESFARDEGMRHPYDIDNARTNLWELTKRNHIYLGIHPYVNQDKITTIIYQDEIESVNSCDDVLFTIGKTHYPESLYVITLNELFNFFKSNKHFYLPHNARYYFEDFSINKLEQFCMKSLEQNHSEEIENMIKLIKEIKESEQDVQSSVDKINNLDESDKETIRVILNHIKELAFYMRGWKVNNNESLPLASEETQSKDVDFAQIESNYTIQYVKLLEVYENSSEELQGIINDIYLMVKKEKKDETVFIRSPSNEIGISVMERLEKINKNENDNSCIRLSSNYILYTVWFYFRECFDEIPFDLEQVSIIN